MDRARATHRITGLAGLTAAVLFGTGNALWAFDQPHPNASAAQIIAFYTGDSSWIIAGASLSLISFVPFIVFTSGLRAVLSEVDNDILANTAFAGGVLLVVAGLGAETINMVGALRAGDDQLSPSLGQAVFEISYALGYNAAGIGAGIVLLAPAAVGLRNRRAFLTPVSATFLSVIGLAFLTPLSQYLLAPAVLLLAISGAALLRPASSTRAAHAESTSAA